VNSYFLWDIVDIPRTPESGILEVFTTSHQTGQLAGLMGT